MIVSCPSCQTGFHLRADSASPDALARCGRCRSEVPLSRPRRSYRVLPAAAAPRALFRPVNAPQPALAMPMPGRARVAAAAVPHTFSPPLPPAVVRRLDPVTDPVADRSTDRSDTRTRWALSMLVGAAIGSLTGPPLGASALLSIAAGTALGAAFAAGTALWSSSRT